jgi:alcohol dehydrogenase
VESVGEGVNDLKENDKVVLIFNGECGECKCCMCKKTNMCEKSGVDAMKKLMCDGTSRFSSIDGKPIFHFLNTSTFSEYTVVDSACAVKLNTEDNLSLKKLTLLSCGVSTGRSLFPFITMEFLRKFCLIYSCYYVNFIEWRTCENTLMIYTTQ